VPGGGFEVPEGTEVPEGPTEHRLATAAEAEDSVEAPRVETTVGASEPLRPLE
jgi:hypothetical protein